MISLTPEECRVLGVLVEKELTTPEQYPLTLNAAVNGCNQKSNRDPVVNFDDDLVHDALEGLRAKGLVVRVDQHGSRVPKYRQELTAKLQLTKYELVILAELMLRGPQTLGELRGRASRMHHLDTLDVVREMVEKLMRREEPLAKELPGGRAQRFAQLLCPEAHPAEAAGVEAAAAPAVGSVAMRVEKLEAEVEQLKGVIRRLAGALGEGDPFSAAEEKSAAGEGG